jgi:hypothetical protein
MRPKTPSGTTRGCPPKRRCRHSTRPHLPFNLQIPFPHPPTSLFGYVLPKNNAEEYQFQGRPGPGLSAAERIVSIFRKPFGAPAEPIGRDGSGLSLCFGLRFQALRSAQDREGCLMGRVSSHHVPLVSFAGARCSKPGHRNRNAHKALALKLSRNPARLASLQQKLARNRETSPLFRTAVFARHIEAACTKMWHWHCRGEFLTSFAVSPIP